MVTIKIDRTYAPYVKFVQILGPSRVPGKVRVRVWSAASESYSNPRTARPEDLQSITPGFLTAKQRAAAIAARRKAEGK